MTQKELATKIFSIETRRDFEEAAMEIFRFQAAENTIYREFISNLNIDPASIKNIPQIPFLPIEFFKSQKVISTESVSPTIFSSSGTTGMITSLHHVSDITIYEQSFRKAFDLFYGDVSNYCILALLPSYLEREGSSLIYMVNDLILRSKNADSGFYLHNLDELVEKLQTVTAQNQKIILIGVTYALLDLAEQIKEKIPQAVILETGGMKGKRKEMIREELHDLLCDAFGVEKIHSEYGMTELLSQAYSFGNGIFKSPPWMRVLIRDVNDPFTLLNDHRTGGINVIDLANIHSCSFIATQDLGRQYEDGTFEILGRFDSSDLRGCNLLVG